jgi:hypothetical protein
MTVSIERGNSMETEFSFYDFPPAPKKPVLKYKWRSEIVYKNAAKAKKQFKKQKEYLKHLALYQKDLESWRTQMLNLFSITVKQQKEALLATNHNTHLMSMPAGLILIGDKPEMPSLDGLPEALRDIIQGKGKRDPKNPIGGLLDAIKESGGVAVAIPIGGPEEGPGSARFGHRTKELGSFMEVLNRVTGLLGPISDPIKSGQEAVKEWSRGKSVDEMRRVKDGLEKELSLHKNGCATPMCDMDKLLQTAIDSLAEHSRLSIQ